MMTLFATMGAHLAVGFVVAIWFRIYRDEPYAHWWHWPAMILLYPLLPILFVVFMAIWAMRGSR